MEIWPATPEAQYIYLFTDFHGEKSSVTLPTELMYILPFEVILEIIWYQKNSQIIEVDCLEFRLLVTE